MNALVRFDPSPEARVTLLPSQRAIVDDLASMAGRVFAIGVAGGRGMGKSTILRAAAAELGGIYIGLGEMLSAVRAAPPEFIDLPLYHYLRDRLAECDVLVVDDLCRLLDTHFTRDRMPRMMVEQLFSYAEAAGKTLILSGRAPTGDITIAQDFTRNDVPVREIPSFGHEDYAAIIAHGLGAAAVAAIDFNVIFRTSPALTGHNLRVVANIAALNSFASTRELLSVIQEFVIASSTRADEVENISFDTLPGAEDIAEALETNVVLPLTDLDLAESLNLRAKRGVLLYGPPGTGKTTVGRALANRLEGRFFLIDGSVPTEPAYTFLPRIQAIVREAIANAPSVLFIDDADVLFDIAHVASFTRYLLTVLDGLATAGAGKVCVMMTAMDPRKVPAAILRSGRVELWLETRLPDAGLRAQILRRWTGDKLPASGAIDFAKLANATQGFTPADLRRIAGDARAYYGADLAAAVAPRTGDDYLAQAVDAVIATRLAMAINLADPSLRVG